MEMMRERMPRGRLQIQRTHASLTAPGSRSGKSTVTFLHVGPRGELTAHSEERLPVRERERLNGLPDSPERPAVLFWKPPVTERTDIPGEESEYGRNNSLHSVTHRQ